MLQILRPQCLQQSEEPVLLETSCPGNHYVAGVKLIYLLLGREVGHPDVPQGMKDTAEEE